MILKVLFLNFYSTLWSDSSNNRFFDVYNAFPNDLPKISDLNGMALSCDVTREEVYDTVHDLPSGKSIRPDSFKAKFDRFYWSEIGDHLFSVVKYFFSNSIMPSSWGKTYIALIPNKENPIPVFDFCPIFLSNVCFKITQISHQIICQKTS